MQEAKSFEDLHGALQEGKWLNKCRLKGKPYGDILPLSNEHYESWRCIQQESKLFIYVGMHADYSFKGASRSGVVIGLVRATAHRGRAQLKAFIRNNTGTINNHMNAIFK